MEGVVTVVGVTQARPDTQRGPLKITLKPREERKDNVSAIIERLQEKVGRAGLAVFSSRCRTFR